MYSNVSGKVNSLFGVCEALMPLVYGPMYSATYAATMTTFPGAFLLLGGTATIPAVIIFAWMYFQTKREERNAIKDGASAENEKNANLTTDTFGSHQILGNENAAFELEKYKF